MITPTASGLYVHLLSTIGRERGLELCCLIFYVDEVIVQPN